MKTFVITLAVALTLAWPQAAPLLPDTTVDLIASRFKFEPSIISVAQGDRVRLRLRSADRDHRFAIKAFRIEALVPKTGEAVTVDFVADRAGTFAFTCAEYCGTGHSAMKGRLVVRAKDN